MCSNNDDDRQQESKETPIHHRSSVSSNSDDWKDEEIGETMKMSSHYTPPLVELSLENITYSPITKGTSSPSILSNLKASSSPNTSNRTTILHNVSTTISPYKLTAWMGPSGSGKTSLLTIAAGLYSPDTLSPTSTIKVNGSPDTLPKRFVGLVWQDDLLLSNLTVEETVTFAARLKSPPPSSSSTTDNKTYIQDIVDQTLHQLNLHKIRNSLIGGGISGGERKRVAVAVELVSRPSILLLDEPTSGLDATTAQKLIGTLKELADIGHAIVIVVHQPRTTIYQMFDDLLLLSQGRVVYNGDAMDAQRCIEACHGVDALPPRTGIADWIMDVIVHDEKRKSENGDNAAGPLLPNHWEKWSKEELTAHSSASSQKIKQRTQLSRRLSSVLELKSTPKFNASFFTQLLCLTKRSMKQTRGERLTTVSLLVTLSYITFSSLLWFRLEDNTSRIFERQSLLFFMIIAQSNSIVVSSVSTFSGERALLKRERAKKMYGVLPYFIAKTASDMVHTTIFPCIYGAVTYWMANLRSTPRAFFFYLLAFDLTLLTAQSTGLFLSILIPNVKIALMLGPLFTLFLMIVGGFYIPLGNLHVGIRWASYISMARYGFSAFIVNEFGGGRMIPCASSDQDVSLSYGEGGLTTGGDQYPLSGEEVIASLGITGVWNDLWVNVGLLAVMQVVLRLASYVLLRRSN